jgi:hypothetical protein
MAERIPNIHAFKAFLEDKLKCYKLIIKETKAEKVKE